MALKIVLDTNCRDFPVAPRDSHAARLRPTR